MKPPAVSAADTDRIERALEGLLPAAELAALQADVIRDPALRAAYAERASLHAALRAERDVLPSLLGPSASTAARDATPPARWPFRTAVFAAVAAAGIALLLALRPAPPPAAPVAPPIATLVSSDHTKWAPSTLPTAAHSVLGPGTLSLLEGIATVTFASGASVTIEAPTKVELVGPLLMRLIEGSLTAEVPPGAHGFTVETADLRVVDLGTRFGVTASSTGNSHVIVFEGLVQLDDAKGASRTLAAGKSYHVRSGAVNAGNLEPAQTQKLDRIDGWTSIPTAFGRGKDAFARRGYTVPEPQPLLMVKHSDLPASYQNERRIFLTFDLSDVKTAAVTEAELLLDPEPSGMGFTAMVPDSRFAVYGVVDESADFWSETGLAWETAPGAGDELDPARFRRLAEFTLVRGASGAPFAVGGKALHEFLKTDTNGLATFVLVRETGETEAAGLVHAFASKEHPTARPPTLRVR